MNIKKKLTCSQCGYQEFYATKNLKQNNQWHDEIINYTAYDLSQDNKWYEVCGECGGSIDVVSECDVEIHIKPRVLRDLHNGDYLKHERTGEMYTYFSDGSIHKQNKRVK